MNNVQYRIAFALLVLSGLILPWSGGCLRADYEHALDPLGASGLVLGLDVGVEQEIPRLQVQGVPNLISEGQSAQIFLRMEGPIGSGISISVSSSDPAIVPSAEVIDFSADGEGRSRIIVLTAAPDTDLNDETARLTFSGPGIAGTEFSITNVDADARGFVIGGVRVITEGGNGVMTVRLAGAPSGPITANVSSDDPGRLTVSPSTLNFTPANYSIPQNVTLTGLEDSDWIPNVKFITVAEASLGQARTDITIQDNDTVFAPGVMVQPGNSVGAMAMGDMDGDGKDDVVLAVANTIALYRSTSAGSVISFNLDNSYTASSFPDFITLRDFDGDGKLDVIATSGFINGVDYYRNTSSPGSLSLTPRIAQVLNTDSPDEIAAADFDGDGKDDVVLVRNRFGGQELALLQNTSSGIGNLAFAAPSFLAMSDPEHVFAADLDGDAKPEIIATTALGGILHVWRNTSSGAGNFNWSTQTIPSISGQGVTAADMDGDGKREILVADYSDRVVILRNTSTVGSPSFTLMNTDLSQTSQFVSGVGVFASLQDVVTADLDGDGKQDLITVNGGDALINVFRNSGSSGIIKFDAQFDFSIGIVQNLPLDVLTGDVNGDGRPDVGLRLDVTSFADGAFIIFRNTLP